MPQLDFFTFSNQFLITIFCFFGLYYSNLFILFPKIKWFYLFKHYLPKLYILDVQLDVEETFSDTWAFFEFLIEQSLIHTQKLERKIMQLSFINISKSTKLEHEAANTILFLTLISLLVVMLFTNNCIEFNAEKLMFIYFLLLISIIVINGSELIKLSLEKEIKKYLLEIALMEEEYCNRLRKILEVTKFTWDLGLIFIKSNILLTLIRVKKLINA